ncbi:MAG: hypothetical protein DMG13_33185 [Acidobacteria bacterium]|nr:MAG: hypothetical protein DMG13_33185 [Acidobacteriota bacterium]
MNIQRKDLPTSSMSKLFPGPIGAAGGVFTRKHLSIPTRRRKRMRAAIYARIACATEERILSQSATLRSYAAKNGAEVVEEFTDDGYSGLRLDRPGLERMRRLAAQGGFDVLLTSGPDRLARKHELLAVILEELKGLGIKTVFVDDGGDNVIADNPLGPGRAGRWPELEQAKVSDSEKSVVLALGQETAR